MNEFLIDADEDFSLPDCADAAALTERGVFMQDVGFPSESLRYYFGNYEA